MAANPLIPTPRVDKNGRTTIRHMKAESPSAASPAIPMMTSPNGEEWPRKSVLNVIYGVLGEHSEASDKELKKMLKSLSDADLFRVKDIAASLQHLWSYESIRMSRNARQVEKSISNGDTDSVHFYHRYREQVNSGHSYEHLYATRAALEEMGVYDPHGEDEPVSFEAHMKMTLGYVPLEEEKREDDDEEGLIEMKARQSYSRVSHLMEYVEKYPERVDAIMEFRSKRDSSTFSDMVEYFNTTDEWKAPAVREGWL